jgi:hypothetical protein
MIKVSVLEAFCYNDFMFDKEIHKTQDNPESGIRIFPSRGYILSNLPTGWYAPELLSTTPLLQDPEDEPDLPPLEEFIASFPKNLAKTALK